MNKETKLTLIPSYYKRFQCIGGKCEDTCCAGWYIAIDESAYKKYKKVKHPEMKKRLDKEIVVKKGSNNPEHVAKIKLKNNRCAFLTEGGWCDIYTHLGESYLSHTCNLYPRTMNKVGNRIEYSLTTSCPEATRQILLEKEGITFCEGEVGRDTITISAQIKFSEKKPQVWRDYFLTLREGIVIRLQNRAYTFEERLIEVALFIQQVERLIEKGQLEKIPEVSTLGAVQRGTDEEASLILMETRKVLELALLLKQLFKEKKCNIKRYTMCFDEMLEGLALSGKITFQDSKKYYEEGLKTHYLPFLKDKGYMLENYFVNYIFERCMPLDGQTPMKSFKRMMLYYHLIKLHLIGIASKNGSLTEEMVITLIQVFTKAYDHGEGYIDKILELV